MIMTIMLMILFSCVSEIGIGDERSDRVIAVLYK